MNEQHTQVADLLDDAADVIERDGWCQNDLGTPDGQVCAMGALAKASGQYVTRCDGKGAWAWGLGDDNRHVSAAVRALESAAGITRAFAGVPWWNDDASRSQREVLDAFRLAAKQQRRLADDIAGGAA